MNIPIAIDPFLPELERIDREIRDMPQQAKDLQAESLKLRRELRVLKEFQPRQRNILRSQEIERLFKEQPKRRAELEKDKKIYGQAEEIFQKICHDSNAHIDVETIINNFVSTNISFFLKLDAIKRFKRAIYSKVEVSRGTLIVGDSWSFDIPPRGCGSLLHQMELLVNVLSEFVECSVSLIWLISCYLVLLGVIEYYSEKWLILYPEFDNIHSKSAAIETYVELGHETNSNDSFQFICWLYYNAFVQGNFVLAAQSVESEIVKLQENDELAQFKSKMLSKRSRQSEQTKRITMEIVDKYSGLEFEQFIGSLFVLDGYQVGYTGASNDKGIDVIARRNGVSIGIQCKCYSSTVGISAVQEVFSGKSFYNLDRAMVITNSYFTKAAADLAKSTDVVLWDRDVLAAKMSIL